MQAGQYMLLIKWTTHSDRFASLGGSIYWVAFIGVAFNATTITTLIADATNVNYGPIIAPSNNWTLQALAATCATGVRFTRGERWEEWEAGDRPFGVGYEV